MSATGGRPAPVLITLESPPEGRAVALGEMVTVTVVEASNLMRDVREMITNALGGRMRRYEQLIERAHARADARFREVLAEKGYDGALGVRIAHPPIVDGAAVLMIYGTGFRWK